MIKKLGTLFVYAVFACNVIAVAVMLLCAFSGYVAPTHHSLLANVSLGFPFAVVLNVAFLVFWMVFYRRFAWLAFVGLLLCAHPMYLYCPVNLATCNVPDSCIKVLSYNVRNFQSMTGDDVRQSLFVDYFRNSQADVICLQEAGPREKIMAVTDELRSLYPYTDVTGVGSEHGLIAVLSKFPILSVTPIQYASRGNGSVCYQLLMAHEPVNVINNHFESNRLTEEDLKTYRNVLENIKEADVNRGVKNDSRYLIHKLGAASAARSYEVDSVALYMEQRPEASFILCGDFNDNPLSYTHHRLTHHLKDAFEDSGNGFGFSYKQNSIWVRIDYVMYTPDWQAYGCKVDKTIKESDHYPIFTWLKRTK